MSRRNPVVLITAIVSFTLSLTSLTEAFEGASLQFPSALAQEEIEKSGDLSEPEGGLPFGGDTVGTYSIGQDRYGLRTQVDMDDAPANGTVYVAWLVDNSTNDDIGIGELVDDELAVTQQITNSSLYNLIEVTQEALGEVTTSRNQSAVVAGAQLDN